MNLSEWDIEMTLPIIYGSVWSNVSPKPPKKGAKKKKREPMGFYPRKRAKKGKGKEHGPKKEQ